MFNDNRPIGCRAGNIDATGTIRRASFRLPAPRARYENPWNSRDRDKNNPPVDRYSRASRVTRLTSGRTPSRDEVDATPFPRFRDDAAAAAADSAVFAAPIPTGLIPFFLSSPPLFFFRTRNRHTHVRAPFLSYSAPLASPRFHFTGPPSENVAKPSVSKTKIRRNNTESQHRSSRIQKSAPRSHNTKTALGWISHFKYHPINDKR